MVAVSGFRTKLFENLQSYPYTVSISQPIVTKLRLQIDDNIFDFVAVSDFFRS